MSCQTSKKPVNDDERIKLFKERGLKVYKKFYEPRLGWFAQQREYMRYLRQDETYYKTNLEKLSSVKLTRNTDVKNPEALISSSYESDIFFDVTTQDFMANLKALPGEYQSTQGNEDL